ncbi:MAG: acyl-CoA dehydrogenase family protein [Candidatus Velthaea sp.]
MNASPAVELRAEVAAWVRAEIAPQARAIDRDDRYPTEIIKAAAARGYTALTLPAMYGGGALGMHDLTMLYEEVSRASAAVGISLITIFQAQTMIELYGGDRLKDEFLPRFRAGLITSYALTESAHGSDIRTLDTKAVRCAEGWRIDGLKAFITSGDAAEAFVILAQTDAGVSVFVVERDRAGVRPFIGERSETIGLRNGPHVDVAFDGVVIPEHYLIGIEGKGVRQAVTVLNHSRVLAAAISLGIGRAAYDDSLKWAMERRAFGQAIFDFQGLQWKFADMRTALRASSLLTYDAAAAHDRGEDAIEASSMAKTFASETATRCALDGMQMCGAYGISENASFGRYLRDAKAYEVAGGSSEILRNTIAKQIKRRYEESNLA